MKKTIFIILYGFIFLSLWSLKSNADGEENLLVKLKIGDKNVIVNSIEKTLDAEPVIENGRTLVPIRFIAEEFGFKVIWSPSGQIQVETQTPKGSILKYVCLNIGQKQATVGQYNSKQVDLDTPPFIKDGRTMVPLRFIAEAFDMDVDWNVETQAIFIKNKDMEFNQDSNGYIIKKNPNGAFNKSVNYFIDFQDVGANSNFLIAHDDDGFLYTVSKIDLKCKKISDDKDGIVRKIFDNKVYYTEEDLSFQPAVTLLKETNGKSETIIEKGGSLIGFLGINNKLYFENRSSKLRIESELKYIDLNTNEVFSLNSPVNDAYDILYISEKYFLYICSEGDKYVFHLVSDNKVNEPLLALERFGMHGGFSVIKQHQANIYLNERSVIVYKNNLFINSEYGIYKLELDKKLATKLSDLKTKHIYLSDNKLYFANDLEIGYINLETEKYSKLFSQKDIFRSYQNQIIDVEDNGNITFTTKLQVAPQVFDIYTYKYIKDKNEIMLSGYSAGLLPYFNKEKYDDLDKKVGKIIPVDN